MKEILDILIKNKIVCKELKPLKVKTRKKIDIYLGVNLKNEYCLIVVLHKKSRILKKDIEEILPLIPEINFRYKKKILLTKAIVCSKVKESFKEWRIIWF